jgi:DNA-binding HxlR family transcriptional regulator
MLVMNSNNITANQSGSAPRYEMPMREPTFANLDCSIARTFVMVRDAWSFLILRDAMRSGHPTFRGL